MKSKIKYFALIWLVTALAACSQQGPVITNPISTPPSEESSSRSHMAEVTFEVIVPADSPKDQDVAINFLNEVSGLGMNVNSYPMKSPSSQRYAISLEFPIGSVIKYRYSRLTPSAPLEEHLSDNRQVRYRLYYVEGSGVIEDVISRWTDTPFLADSGRIMGQVTEADTGIGIPNVLVTAGGAQTFTSAEGAYLLEGLPPGTHNLVAYALDGSYRTFQQGAKVASEATTPAPIVMEKSPLVDVTFHVTVPQGTIPAVPLRLAGNLTQFGNTFGTLRGGLSTIAERMPVLTALPDQQYSLTLSLPVGADIRYFYTLGDGFWNTEKTITGGTPVRQIIVPAQPLRTEDQIAAWRKNETVTPLTFDIQIPETTPERDQISIQFDPLIGWMEPIPMWKLSPTRWVYILNDPVDFQSTLRYRICRNSQCGTADEAATSGITNRGLAVAESSELPLINHTVGEWAWNAPNSTTYEASMSPVIPRSAEFIAGIEFLPDYSPNWNYYLPGSMATIEQYGANWAVLTPSWGYTRTSPPILEIVPGMNPLWQDVEVMVRDSRNQNLAVAIYPSIIYPQNPDTWWSDGNKDFSWWIVWFEQYRRFAIHHAELAARSGAQLLILGGEWLAPALPDGRMDDGTYSNVPADADQRWREIIAAVRQHYAGPVAWAIPYEQAASNPPSFLDAVDQLYILFSPPLTENQNALPEEIASSAGQLLDEYILPLRLRLEKPVILAAGYASISGAASSCLPGPEGRCLPASESPQPDPENLALPVDLQEQADIYNGLLMAVNERYWINGFTSRGFYPPIALQDKSTSIHGKPAATVLTYWFPRLLGELNP